MVAASTQQYRDSGTEFAAFSFMVQSILSRVSTATLVRVISCTNSGGLSPWGTIDAQPLVSQIAGDGTAVPHGPIFQIPYLRIQGGTNAVIIDPAPGDIGIAVFCARDISSLKSQDAIDQVKAGAPGVTPASRRQYNLADGLYLGGVLNGVPVQFIRFAADQIEVVSPTKITLRAPEIDVEAATKVKIDGPTTEVSGANITIAGSSSIAITSPATTIPNATIDGRPFLAHEHSGVQSGSNNSGGVV